MQLHVADAKHGKKVNGFGFGFGFHWTKNSKAYIVVDTKPI